MITVKHIPRDELTRDPLAVFQAVRQGRSLMVEDRGHPQAALVDPVDLRILLAVVRYYIDRPQIDPEAGLAEVEVSGLDGQRRFDAAVAHYLAEAISLSRTAEILDCSWLELRDRFSGLGIPLHTGPTDEAELRQDILVAESSLS